MHECQMLQLEQNKKSPGFSGTFQFNQHKIHEV